MYKYSYRISNFFYIELLPDVSDRKSMANDELQVTFVETDLPLVGLVKSEIYLIFF